METSATTGRTPAPASGASAAPRAHWGEPIRGATPSRPPGYPAHPAPRLSCVLRVANRVTFAGIAP